MSTNLDNLKTILCIFRQHDKVYSSAELLQRMHAGRTETASKERFRECFFRLAESSLFNMCGWIVSIKNCCKVISRTHKDQACGIYCLYLELGMVPAHTACQSVDFDFDREAHPTPSVNGSGIQVFTGLPASQAHRGVWCGIWEVCSRVSPVPRVVGTNKQLFTEWSIKN